MSTAPSEGEERGREHPPPLPSLLFIEFGHYLGDPLSNGSRTEVVQATTEAHDLDLFGGGDEPLGLLGFVAFEGGVVTRHVDGFEGDLPAVATSHLTVKKVESDLASFFAGEIEGEDPSELSEGKFFEGFSEADDGTDAICFFGNFCHHFCDGRSSDGGKRKRKEKEERNEDSSHDSLLHAFAVEGVGSKRSFPASPKSFQVLRKNYLKILPLTVFKFSAKISLKNTSLKDRIKRFEKEQDVVECRTRELDKLSKEEREMGQEERESILESLFLFKDRLDYLEARGFFRKLLEYYRELEKVEGFGEWVGLYRSEGECTECEERKRRLLTGLIFTFGESRILEVLERLGDLRDYLREVGNE